MSEKPRTPAAARLDVERTYHQMLDAWNRRDAAGMAAQFAPDGYAIGFDGSGMHGADEIAATVGRIFTDHETASYVPIVRDVTFVAPAVAIVRAHVGMVPPGQHDINPATNAVQALVVVDTTRGWRIALLQNTPAAYHGRPEAAQRLTAELRVALTQIGDA